MQARLRHRLAEVGHAVPDDERAERRRDDGEPEAASERAQQKRLKHGCPRAGGVRPRPPLAGSPARSWR